MPCPENVVDADDILMVETQQDLDFPQRALAVRLVLERADFLDGDALVSHVVQSGAAETGGCGKRKDETGESCYTLGRYQRRLTSARNGRCCRLTTQKLGFKT